jgi:hypothetical protein
MDRLSRVVLRPALGAVRDTVVGTGLMVGAFMLFMACIYVGALLNVALWTWLASIF